jgi:hypothetical protein
MFGKKSHDYVPPAQLPGRNDPCHCGSGKKYKKCCEEKDATAKHAHLEKQWEVAEKEAAKKAEEEKKAADSNPQQPTTSHKPSQQTQVSGQKRNILSVPKFNAPRRTGGG